MQEMIVDLRSDTLTKPSKQMLEAMLTANVGDDVFGEDPTVIKLENKIAEMFGKEAALYCPSGTQTNQIAIRVQTQPGDELICDSSSHIYRFEGGGISYNSLTSVRLIDGDRGRIKATDIAKNINPNDIHHPRTSLVSLENTCNKGGGSYYDFDEILAIKKVCDNNGLKLHLDGARLFNALAETTQTPKDYGKVFDSISICLSKGLGAPVGSLLIGTNDFIQEGRRVRKVFGGAMRQAGFIAAAGLYALENNTERLKTDHKNAKILSQALKECVCVEKVLAVDTNIIMVNLNSKYSAKEFMQKLQDKGIKSVGFGPQTIRLVTHLDINDKMIDYAVKIFKSME